MKSDPGSNFTIVSEDLSATDTTAAFTAVDHSKGPAATFCGYVKSVGTSFDAKVQYSENNSDWTDDDGSTGNDSSITQMTAAGSFQLNVPNPRGRYSRVLTTAVGAVVAAGSSLVGPLRRVSPA